MTLTSIITILIVLASLILILVVLVQKSKGGGLSSNFSSSNAVMGVKKTTDVVEKITWGLAAFIMVLSIACVRISMTEKKSLSNTPQIVAPETPQSTPDLSTTLPLPPAPAPTQAPAN